MTGFYRLSKQINPRTRLDSWETNFLAAQVGDVEWLLVTEASP
jgi:hypothetical protein